MAHTSQHSHTPDTHRQPVLKSAHPFMGPSDPFRKFPVSVRVLRLGSPTNVVGKLPKRLLLDASNTCSWDRPATALGSVDDSWLPATDSDLPSHCTYNRYIHTKHKAGIGGVELGAAITGHTSHPHTHAAHPSPHQQAVPTHAHGPQPQPCLRTSDSRQEPT